MRVELPQVASVNVGQPRTVLVGRTEITSAIWKEPVVGRVRVGATNVEGDRQADLRAHGGQDKAVYAYAAEDLQWWAEQLGREIGPGMFGENLTTTAVDLTACLIGERWTVGSTVLEVASPRIPCFKLAARFDDPGLPRRFAAAGRPGAYLRVAREGDLAAGDRIDVVYRPSHDVTVGLVARAYHQDHDLVPLLLEAAELPEDWRRWAGSMGQRPNGGGTR